MKKVLWPGLVAGVAMLITGMIVTMAVSAIFPGLAVQYENTSLFRAWEDPLMSLFFAAPILLGLILSHIWSHAKNLFKHKKPCKRGAHFGFCYWVVTIPGMIITYSSFPISLGLVASWSASILIQGVVAGIILSKMNK
ncbi:hypothetical protein JW826_03255 [Candidatus Woesearchaeota archaeon]|nr:hypothetical protein [Candidatus Woesearchaeota archaeon]